jgi:hypothetical protein
MLLKNSPVTWSMLLETNTRRPARKSWRAAQEV